MELIDCYSLNDLLKLQRELLETSLKYELYNEDQITYLMRFILKQIDYIENKSSEDCSKIIIEKLDLLKIDKVKKKIN